MTYVLILVTIATGKEQKIILKIVRCKYLKKIILWCVWVCDQKCVQTVLNFCFIYNIIFNIEAANISLIKYTKT